MKHVTTERLIELGAFAESREFATVRKEIDAAIRAVVWPSGNDRFVIHPRPKGNGVVPIKDACMEWLAGLPGWTREVKLGIGTRTGAGSLDAIKRLPDGRVYGLEWETGNISSSHRSLNKLALGIIDNVLVGGTLILPTRKLYRYLTDRIGSLEELAPYFPLWRHVCPDEGVLNVMAVEYDAVDPTVPLIPKGTDGRALL